MFDKLRQLFASDGPAEMVDYSVLGADMHSHLIPGIDDGSPTVEESIELLRQMHYLGYNKVFTTPHIMENGYTNTPETILGGLEKVRAALAETPLQITIDAAGEYYYDDNFQRLLKDKQLLTFSDNYVLFELPMMNMPRDLKETVFALKTQAYQPVLAHVERYPYLHEGDGIDDLQHMVDMGLLLQVNVATFINVYGPELQGIAYNLLQNNMISFIGSDLHNRKHLGYLQRALEDKKFNAALQNHTFLNSQL